MMKVELTCREQIEDFVRGLTFYGTGGGGSYQRGIDLLVDQLSKGNKIGWVDIDKLENDEFTCCPFLMGSLAGPSKVAQKEMTELYNLPEQLSDETARMVKAIHALENKMGEKVAALVPIELGGSNVAACISAAAEMGIHCLDGDYTGRAIPEIQQTTPYIFEQELLPITACDAWNNMATIEKTINWRMAERIGKQLSVAGFSYSSQAGFFARGIDTKKSIIKNTLSECLKIGEFLRKVVEEGKDPADEIAILANGWVITKGKVTRKIVEDRDDYYYVTHEITGTEDYEGQDLKIWVKNESHISWLNGEVFVTSPDMIQIIDKKTGHPYTNNVIEEGMEVSVIVMKAREVFRKERGIEVLGPKAFGFDINYTPVEELLSRVN